MFHWLGAKYDEKKAKSLIYITSAGMVIVVGGEYLVYTHYSFVPITERKQHIVRLEKRVKSLVFISWWWNEDEIIYCK